ncbi:MULTISPECIES: hypothetical protein [Falsihalocynthiibacter]|uniref:hypothetical protein n=1 Tax=Falsihalocynthiibacter TaxID=2854182 RepID=UPI00300147FE
MTITELYLRLFFVAAPAIVTYFAARRVLHSRSDHWAVYIINVAWGAYVTVYIGRDIFLATSLPIEAFAVATTPVVFWIATVAFCNRRNNSTRRYASSHKRPSDEHEFSI